MVKIRKPHPNARKLRKTMPPAELRLWYFLRGKRLTGLRFRRQHTIGPYIVDFACLDPKIIIEADGGQHAGEDHFERDLKRDAYLDEAGYRVVRVWNKDVFDNIDGVLEAILRAAEA